MNLQENQRKNEIELLQTKNYQSNELWIVEQHQLIHLGTKLRFKQYHVILAKRELVVTKIMISFEGENMQTKKNFKLWD